MLYDNSKTILWMTSTLMTPLVVAGPGGLLKARVHAKTLCSATSRLCSAEQHIFLNSQDAV